MKINLTDLMVIVPKDHTLHITLTPKGDVKMKLTYGTYEIGIGIGSSYHEMDQGELQAILVENLTYAAQAIQDNRKAIQMRIDEEHDYDDNL